MLVTSVGTQIQQAVGVNPAKLGPTMTSDISDF